MVHHEVIAMAVARTAELVRTSPGAREEQTAALRCLVALSSLGSNVFRLEDGVLSVDGAQIPHGIPAVGGLIAQMRAHAIAEIGITQGSSTQDLLDVVLALAADATSVPAGAGVERTTRDSGTKTVRVVRAGSGDTVPTRRPPAVAGVVDGVSIRGAIEQEALRDSPLAAALRALEAQPAGPAVLNRLSDVAAQVALLVEEGKIEIAVRAIAIVLRHEASAPETARSSYAIAIKRMLPPGTVEEIARLAPDQRYAGDVIRVLQRLGSDGTGALLRLLATADTTGNGRMYMNALREMREGLHLAVEMLAHKQWFVVRNVCELLGELRVIDAVPALAEVLDHAEPRVRRSAAVALAKIGTPAAALHLRKTMKEGAPEIRGLVAGAIGGRASGALAMPLVVAADTEENPDLVREYYQALGRIGSADAIRALAEAAQPGGRLLNRRQTDSRLAAVEGLTIAGGPAAIKTLEGLAEDGDRAVRESAGKALEKLRRSGPEADRRPRQ